MAFDFARLKEAFFDSAKVLASVDAGLRKVLSKFGAFIRRRARSSIRKRKRASAVGQPPSSHAGQLKLIFFAWDAQTKSVVVGPIQFASKQGGSAVVPGLLERGGQITVPDKRSATGKRATPRQAAAYRQLILLGRIVPPPRGRKTITIGPRPYMNPALQAEKPRFAEQLKGMLR